MNDNKDKYDLINELYENGGTIKDKKTINEISSLPDLFPMYDIFIEDIVLSSNENIEYKIFELDYRPINKSILQLIKNTKNKKLITFMKNFDADVLEKTFFENNKDLRNRFTSYKKKSFLFILNSRPYYYYEELEGLRVLYGIKEKDNSLLCDVMKNYEISSDDLLKHSIFIRENNAKTIVSNYVYFQSYTFNNYLRYPSQHFRNIVLENQINNFYSLIKKAPSITTSIYVFRWLEKDDFLKNYNNGDTFIDRGFASTRRYPYVDFENHTYYGYYLMMIKIPKDVEGICISVENNVFFREQEITLLPGKYNMIDNNNTKYYNIYETDRSKHKIIRVYELEYISPLDEIYDVNSYKPKININKLDLTSKSSFLETWSNYFYVDIGIEKVLFFSKKTNYLESHIHFNRKNDILMISYDKYSNILLFIEIGETISLNYHNKFLCGTTNITDNYTYDDLIIFLKKLAKVFNINRVLVHSDYRSYNDIIKKTNLDYKNFERFKYIYNSYKYSLNELLLHYIITLTPYPNKKFLDRFPLSSFSVYLYDVFLNIYGSKIKKIMMIDLKRFIKIIKNKYDEIQTDITEVDNTMRLKKILLISDELLKINKKYKLIDLYLYLIDEYYYLTWIINALLNINYKFNLSNIIFEIKID